MMHNINFAEGSRICNYPWQHELLHLHTSDKNMNNLISISTSSSVLDFYVCIHSNESALISVLQH